MIWRSVALLAAAVTAENLYATDYSGFIYSVNLTSGKDFSIIKTQQLEACGSMPSWLEFDGLSRVLYCADENTPNGTLSAFAAAENGTLTELALVETIGGGVDTVLYGGPAGNGYIAIAHYENSAVSTFKLPLVSLSKALQAFQFSLPHPGPNPVRQDAPHPHQVALDPSGQFILNPDLGSDLVRVFSINPNTGILTQCPSLNATAGSGPRHVAFWVPPTATQAHRRGAPPSPCLESTEVNGTVMYLVSELANNLTAFTVDYTPDGCLAFTKTQTSWTFAETPPPGSAVAEVRVSDQTLFVSNRNTSSSLMDSIATFSLSPTDGSFTFQNTTPSYGSWPRTLVVNADKTYVAVGDQDDGAVAFVSLDNATGQLSGLAGKIVLGTGGTMGNGGLSSVIFEEEAGGSEL